VHKNTRGHRAEADAALYLTVSQPRLFNLLDRVLRVTTEFGMVEVARTGSGVNSGFHVGDAVPNRWRDVKGPP
jgi:hypothetical protein